MNALDILKGAYVEGNVVKLPPVQLEKKLYDKVANRLRKAGGRWNGGKTQGFVFKASPTEILSGIQAGEKIDVKQKYQSFFSPPDVANRVVELAEIFHDDKVLEPSAGDGAIIKAIHQIHPELIVDYCELQPESRMDLEKLTNVKDVGEDFLNYLPGEIYDVITANPPWKNNSDIDHIYHMYKMLKPGGRIVSVASLHWDQFDDKAKEQRFKYWLNLLKASVQKLPPGTFKKSGTMFPGCIITINKPLK